MSWFALIILVLILARAAAQFWLDRLNEREVHRNAHQVPAAYAAVVDSWTYSRSVAYTLAKLRLDVVELCYDTVILLVCLYSGMLPWAMHGLANWLGQSPWAGAVALFLIGLALSLLGLPFGYYSQFKIEQQFGFNTMTPRLWLVDRIKAFILAAMLGIPLLTLILKLFEWTGQTWWFWAWLALVVFQLVMMVLAPIVILPWFNKLTPLPEGSLRERLLALGAKTGFHASNILVMDGSKRSRHSNAFFTGFGRWRKIVLFDTLIQQMSEEELEAVLAHEIGHYKKGHIPQMLLLSVLGSLAGFYALHWLSGQDWFYRAFGFPSGTIVIALLLFALLGGLATFWLSPLLNSRSRRFEYEADAFAARAVGGSEPLISALRKLSQKNMSNLTPHPLYSAFYYSHPTLLEREKGLAAVK